VARVTFVNTRVGYLWSTTATYLTLDGGGTWARQPGRAGARYFVAADGMAVRLGFIVTSHSRSPVLEAAPIGTSVWHQIAIPGGGALDDYSVLAVGGQAIYLLKTPANTLSSNGTIKGEGPIAIYRSTNGARGWQKMTENLPAHFLFGLAAGKDDSIAVPVDRSPAVPAVGVHISTDGGLTFGPYRSVPTSEVPPLLQDVSANRLLVAGRLTYVGNPPHPVGTLMYLSTDAGRSWHLVLRDTGDGGPFGPYLSSGFSSTTDGYRLAGDLRSIWITSDGGETWTRHPFR
jgi:hypothetical protein